MYSEHLRELLKNNDLKITPVRLMVLDILIRSDVALSHTRIMQELHNSGIDKVTLYRTLSAFTEKNLIHKIPTDDRNWLYAIFIDQNARPIPDTMHAHFICDECESVYCFPVSENSKERETKGKDGFIINNKEIRLHGICPSCH